MPEIRTELEIAASPNRVWNVLADFEKYPEWNPFLVRVVGAPAQGATVSVHVKSGLIPVTFKTTVLVAEPGRELRWRGHFLSDRVVAGEHYFQIVPAGNGVRFIHGEQFTGAISSLAWQLIKRDAQRGYAAMNAAFKARIEARA